MLFYIWSKIFISQDYINVILKACTSLQKWLTKSFKFSALFLAWEPSVKLSWELWASLSSEMGEWDHLFLFSWVKLPFIINYKEVSSLWNPSVNISETMSVSVCKIFMFAFCKVKHSAKTGQLNLKNLFNESVLIFIILKKLLGIQPFFKSEKLRLALW